MKCPNCGYENTGNVSKCRSCLKEIANGAQMVEFARQNQHKYGVAPSPETEKAEAAPAPKKNPPAARPEPPFQDFFQISQRAQLSPQEEQRYFGEMGAGFAAPNE